MDLLAITSYFNPFGGKLRRQNYETFRRHLGVKLLTVEWSPEGNFDLCERDADYLIQVSGGDLLWQKERLLNIGLARARELGARNVAFLDCDIVFSDTEWHHHVLAALQNYSIIQCYTHVNYLPPVDHASMSRASLASVPPEFTRLSLAYEWLEFDRYGSSVAETLPETRSLQDLSGNPGMAIAIRMESNFHWKIYEGNIVGGGDSVFMAAAANQLDKLFTRRLFSPAHRQSIQSWQAETFQTDTRLGYAGNQIVHLWHGEIEKRKYMERHAILAGHNYDPSCDLDTSQSGALTLKNDRTKIRQEIADYLFSREVF